MILLARGRELVALNTLQMEIENNEISKSADCEHDNDALL